MNYIKFLIITMFVINITITAQDNLENILKAYPNWTTNFEQRSIDLGELLSGGPPKDGIPAIINPKFTTINEAANWLNAKEPVLSIELNGISKAYPLQILLFHEIVNDRMGRTPILVSFCPLCYSGIVFDRTINGMAVNFGVSGLLRNSDLVMYDQLSESFWQQFTGEAIVGDFTGTKLEVISSQILSFEQFRQNYKDGLVLSKDTGFSRPYGMNPYVNYDNVETKPFLFDGDIDDRLPANEKVIAIKYGKTAKAYPYSITSQEKIIHDKIEDINIVVFHIPGTLSGLDQRYIEDSKDVGSTAVYSSELNKKTLEFYFKNDKIFDNQTNSEWSITGKCTNGELKGQQLTKIPHGDYFSFAWFAFMPGTLIYPH